MKGQGVPGTGMGVPPKLGQRLPEETFTQGAGDQREPINLKPSNLLLLPALIRARAPATGMVP